MSSPASPGPQTPTSSSPAGSPMPRWWPGRPRGITDGDATTGTNCPERSPPAKAKGLGENVRSRIVDIPVELIPS